MNKHRFLKLSLRDEAEAISKRLWDCFGLDTLCQGLAMTVVLIFLVSVLWFLVSNCYAAPISSKELIQNAREYDGKEIVFQGEVIGDVMKRGNFCWVNISDGKNALGVFLDNSVLGDIIFTGNYNHIGDIVEVKGIFHRACLTHGGDLDIHATKIIKLKDGYRIIHKTDQKKVRAVLRLTVVLSGIIVIVIIRRIIR